MSLQISEAYKHLSTTIKFPIEYTVMKLQNVNDKQKNLYKANVLKTKIKSQNYSIGPSWNLSSFATGICGKWMMSWCCMGEIILILEFYTQLNCYYRLKVTQTFQTNEIWEFTTQWLFIKERLFLKTSTVGFTSVTKNNWIWKKWKTKHKGE